MIPPHLYYSILSFNIVQMTYQLIYKNMTDNQMKLQFALSDEFLKFAEFYRQNFEGITTSDMQGIAEAQAMDFVRALNNQSVKI